MTYLLHSENDFNSVVAILVVNVYQSKSNRRKDPISLEREAETSEWICILDILTTCVRTVCPLARQIQELSGSHLI